MLVFHEQSSELAAARQGMNTSRADRFDNRRIVGVCRRDLPVEPPSCNELSQSMLDEAARETGWPGATGAGRSSSHATTVGLALRLCSARASFPGESVKLNFGSAELCF
jgi:hypothetical protein